MLSNKIKFVMGDEELIVKFNISRSHLECCVCLNPIAGMIYRCGGALHFLCENCVLKLKQNECPTCRHPSKPFRDLLLEKSLDEYRMTCPNNGCDIKVFKWDEDHEQICRYAPKTCQFCKRQISSSFTKMVKHYEEFCDTNFNILDINPRGNKFKLTPAKKSSILMINNASFGIYCISDIPRKRYYVGAISDLDDYIGKSIKIKVNNSQGDFHFKDPIKIIDTKNAFVHLIVSFNLGNELVFTFGSSNPVQNLENIFAAAFSSPSGSSHPQFNQNREELNNVINNCPVQ